MNDWGPNIIHNIRCHPRQEIAQAAKQFTDEELIERYEEFYFSNAAGNNDERFPEFLVK